MIVLYLIQLQHLNCHKYVHAAQDPARGKESYQVPIHSHLPVSGSGVFER